MKALVVSNLGRHFRLFGHSDFEVLLSMGIEVHIAANFKGKHDEYENEKVTKHQIDFERFPYSLKNLKAIMQIRNLINHNNFDIVHCHSPSGGVITRLGAKLVNYSPIIYTAHGFHFYKGAPFKHFNFLYRFIEATMAKWTDAIITINQEDFEAASLMKTRKKKTFLIPSVGISIDKYNLTDNQLRESTRNDLKLVKENVVAIVIAELTNRKNHKLILEAVSILNNPHLHILIVGRGDLENKLINYAKKLGISSNVHFLGYRNDVPQLLNASDIALLASKNEGFGMCLLESMSASLPVIATNTKGARECIIDNLNGFIVDINDVRKFAESMDYLIKNENTRKIMGEKSRTLVNNFSIDKTKDKMKQIYNECLFLGVSK